MEAGSTEQARPPQDTLRTPLLRTTASDILKNQPELFPILFPVLQEVDTQTMDNEQQVVESRLFADPKTGKHVTIRCNVLKITPEIVKRLTGVTNPPEREERRVLELPVSEQYIFPSQESIKEGGRTSSLDMVTNAFIKGITSVAHEMRYGNPDATRKIILVNSPTTLGAAATPQFAQTVKKRGFAAHGELMADVISQIHTPGRRAIIGGVSRGGVVSQKTLEALRDSHHDTLKDFDSRRVINFDTAGDYSPDGHPLKRFLRKVKLGGGIIGEYGALKLNPRSFLHRVQSGEKDFNKNIAESFTPDSKAQKKIKNKIYRQEQGHLLNGTDFDPDIRVGTSQALFAAGTLDVKALAKMGIREEEGGTGIPVVQGRRHELKIPFKGIHTLFFNNPGRYESWARFIITAKNLLTSPVPEPQKPEPKRPAL